MLKNTHVFIYLQIVVQQTNGKYLILNAISFYINSHTLSHNKRIFEARLGVGRWTLAVGRALQTGGQRCGPHH